MECLRCKSKSLFKANPIQLQVEHKWHDSHLLADLCICSECGHVEMILPVDQLEQQKKYIQEDANQL